MAVLDVVTRWPEITTAGLVTKDAIESEGPADRLFAWASVTKVLVALCAGVAVEEGTLDWDDPAGPPGSTLRHLLAHASGLGPDSDTVLAPPGRRRIYSNRGIELIAEQLAVRAGMPFEEYLKAGVLDPLGLAETQLEGSPASGARGPLTDLMAVARELISPSVISKPTLATITTVAFPGLAGILPGFGRQVPNDWGLGIEIRAHKTPHWTGTLNSPDTFGHFGQSGSFIWVDPRRDLALVSLSEQPFGPWATEAWPALSDSVIRAVSG